MSASDESRSSMSYSVSGRGGNGYSLTGITSPTPIPNSPVAVSSGGRTSSALLEGSPTTRPTPTVIVITRGFPTAIPYLSQLPTSLEKFQPSPSQPPATCSIQLIVTI